MTKSSSPTAEERHEFIPCPNDPDHCCTINFGCGQPRSAPAHSKQRSGSGEVTAVMVSQVSESCKWQEDDDGINWTSCGEGFTLDSGTPSENKMKFCCYCGRSLKEVPYVSL
jgi:hypothetical protein